MSGEIVGFLLWLLSAWEVWMGWIILSRITGARRSGKVSKNAGEQKDGPRHEAASSASA